MRVLLDTHVFIWWDSEPERLSSRAMQLCEDPDNELLLSVGSIWEIQVKTQLGKIELQAPLSDLVAAQQESNHLQLLPIRARHVFELNALPSVHKDPFDRILVAQACVEHLRLLTHDAVLKKYPVEIDW